MSVVIVSHNSSQTLPDAIEPLLGRPGVEIVVLDNASGDGSADLIAERFPQVALLRSAVNLGFAAGVNRAVAQSGGAYLLLLNPDARLAAEGLARLVRVLEARPRAAAVGAGLVYDDGTFQDSAFRFPGLAQVALDLFPIARLSATRVNGRYPRRADPQPVDHLLGACMLIRRAAWDDVGPLDEGYFMYVEEVDWCRRARRRGWEVWHDPAAIATHRAAHSTRQRADEMFVELWRSRLRYYERFHGCLYNRAIRLLVRLGMRAEARRTEQRLQGRPRQRRLEAIRRVRDLAS